jgi:cytochrome c oxidase subunit 2
MAMTSLRAALCHPRGAFLSLAPLLALAGSEADNLNTFDPVSPPGDTIRGLFILVLAVTGVIFLLVEGMLLYCIIRFRQRPGDQASLPPQLYGSKPVEVAWTVAPLLIVFVLFLVVFRTMAQIAPTKPPEGSLKVVVVGHQWWWEYRYPAQTIQGDKDHPGAIQIKEFVTANELHVPSAWPAAFDLESADVIHSFWFPRMNGKTDLVPGRRNQTWFLPLKPGTFQGQCAEYCGNQHATMILRMEADEWEQFRKWAAHQAKPEVWVDRPKELAEAKNDDVRAGRKLFLTNACMNCHAVRGTAAKGTFGPDLTHLMSRKTLASALVPNDEATLTKWIDDPQTIKPGCLMPAMKLTKTQQAQVVKYLRTLE